MHGNEDAIVGFDLDLIAVYRDTGRLKEVPASVRGEGTGGNPPLNWNEPDWLKGESNDAK